MSKKFLTDHDVEFNEHNISEQPHLIEYLKDKGLFTLPVIEKDNNPIISGFRPDQLNLLIQ